MQNTFRGFHGVTAVRRIATASALCFLSSMTAVAQPVAYWLCRSSTGVIGAQDSPCDPSQETVRAPRSAEVPIQPAAPVQPQPVGRPRANLPVTPTLTTSTEPPRVGAPVRRPLPAQNAYLSAISALWHQALWFIAILALVTAGRIWLSRRLPKQRRVIAKGIPGISGGVVHPTPNIPTPQPAAGTAGTSGPPPRIDTVPSPTARPTEWTVTLMRSLEWKRLEELCEGFWKAQGYPARGTGPGSDGGVDVVIADPRDADRIFAIAQCKAWSKPVGVEPVRALWGARHHFDAQLAIFYSVSGFTTDASTFAAGKDLKLVSGDELLSQLQTLPEAERTALLCHVTRGDFSTPSCPKCEIEMIRKTGRAGRSDFWSCPRFGSCRTRPIPVRGAPQQGAST